MRAIISVSDKSGVTDFARGLAAMGFETANIHLGSGWPAAGAAAAILADLELRRQGWLLLASQEMVKATLKDWEVWKKDGPRLFNP